MPLLNHARPRLNLYSCSVCGAAPKGETRLNDFITKLKDLSGNEIKLLITLSYLCGESQTGSTFASNQKLSDISGVSPTGISAILKSLQEAEFIAGITKENGTRKVYLDVTKFQE